MATLDHVSVSFLSSHSRGGGSERYLSTLLKRLDSDWIQDVFCLENGPLVNELRTLGLRPKVIETSHRPTAILASAFRLRRALRTPPDVFHANGVKAALVVALATIGTGVRIVWVKHDVSWDGWLARLIALRCERVVGVSAAVLETFENKPPGRFHIVHNGIEVERGPDRRRDARLAIDSAVGRKGSGAVVALVGRLDPLKGHRELLAAAPLVAARVPGVQFVFIGGPDPSHKAYERKLRAEIDAMPEVDVFLLGHREDAAFLLNGCDVAAIPSIADRTGRGREGFSLVALEAMVVGTPVVGYASGGLPEAVGDCGTLVRSADRVALADAIVAILTDPDRARTAAECGQQRVRQRFTLDRVVAAMKEQYLAASRLPKTGRADG